MSCWKHLEISNMLFLFSRLPDVMAKLAGRAPQHVARKDCAQWVQTETIGNQLQGHLSYVALSLQFSSTLALRLTISLASGEGVRVRSCYNLKVVHARTKLWSFVTRLHNLF